MDNADIATQHTGRFAVDPAEIDTRKLKWRQGARPVGKDKAATGRL